MASKYWIKLYHEILEDPKMGKLPDNLWRRAIELFLLAGDLDQEGELLDTEGIAWRLRLPSNETLQEELQALRKCNIVTQLDNGNWLVIHFAKRQEAVDGAERVRKFRERKKKQAEETPKEEPKADVTKRYTDIDKDREEKETHAPDYLGDVFDKQGQPITPTGHAPVDQHFNYRDDFLKIYQEMTGEYPDRVKKDEIIRVAQAGNVTPECWREGWRTSKLNWTGMGKNPPIARVVEVCEVAGGDYEKFKQWKWPDTATNGRDSPTGLPQGKVTLPAMKNKDGSIN